MSTYLYGLFVAGVVAFCGPSVARAALLKINPLTVRPTQAVVGYSWVSHKIGKFSKMPAEELRDKLREDAAPVVIDPSGDIMLIDGHHEFRALIELGIAAAYVNVLMDFSGSERGHYLDTMLRNGWYYFGDENGQMAHSPDSLPTSIAQLKDDPYRGLASYLRSDGGFKKSKVPHAEFEWANALRSVIARDTVTDNPRKALKLAHEFASSDRAAHLPGYIKPKENIEKQPFGDCEHRLIISQRWR